MVLLNFLKKIIDNVVGIEPAKNLRHLNKEKILILILIFLIIKIVLNSKKLKVLKLLLQTTYLHMCQI